MYHCPQDHARAIWKLTEFGGKYSFSFGLSVLKRNKQIILQCFVYTM